MAPVQRGRVSLPIADRKSRVTLQANRGAIPQATSKLRRSTRMLVFRERPAWLERVDASPVMEHERLRSTRMLVFRERLIELTTGDKAPAMEPERLRFTRKLGFPGRLIEWAIGDKALETGLERLLFTRKLRFRERLIEWATGDKAPVMESDLTRAGTKPAFERLRFMLTSAEREYRAV